MYGYHSPTSVHCTDLDQIWSDQIASGYRSCFLVIWSLWDYNDQSLVAFAPTMESVIYHKSPNRSTNPIVVANSCNCSGPWVGGCLVCSFKPSPSSYSIYSRYCDRIPKNCWAQVSWFLSVIIILGLSKLSVNVNCVPPNQHWRWWIYIKEILQGRKSFPEVWTYLS